MGFHASRVPALREVIRRGRPACKEFHLERSVLWSCFAKPRQATIGGVMKLSALDYFGNALITQVRDATVKHWDMVIEGKMKDAVSTGTHRSIAGQQQITKELVSELIPLVVDACVHRFLVMLDAEAGRMKLVVGSSDTPVTDLAAESDGLAGELYGDRGWISRFSKERGQF